MQDYVVDFPSELEERIKDAGLRAVGLLFGGDSEQTQSTFQNLYSEIRKVENLQTEGKRFHKGDILYWWGFALILQEESQKVSSGYEKLLLAFVEDLLDFETFEQAIAAPASTALLRNPAISKSLLDLVQNQVDILKERHRIPKDPKDVLKPIGKKTQEILEKPSPVTYEQVRPLVNNWLMKNGPKEKRVFIGGNYRNIALLRCIKRIVEDFMFVPIMPIDLTETSKPEYERLIHDISLEILEECSFAIFEVTFSNGHLMEIERANDFKHMKKILVYQITKSGEKPTVTGMLMTDKFEKKGYPNLAELTTEIKSFLKD